ncbi:MAG: hypothetical protein K7J47_07540 [Acidobacteria bacterium]|jgi:hypothetical protein|nr:hypothetical protein [Bryobacteraceae bacterium CoA2 C42]MCA2962912.1 hypothetical protein [Acidobacteriaceae bacterium]
MRIGAVAANLAVLLLLGVGIPWWKGLEFLDLYLLMPYSLLGVLYASPRAVAVALESPISLSDLGRAVLWGWVLGALILVLGLVTVNVSEGRGVLPPAPVVLCLLVCGLLGCLVTAGGAVRVALAARSEGAARQRIRIGFLMLVGGLLAAPRMLGEREAGELLEWLMRGGMVGVTMVLGPVAVMGTLWLLRARMARYTG